LSHIIYFTLMHINNLNKYKYDDDCTILKGLKYTKY